MSHEKIDTDQVVTYLNAAFNRVQRQFDEKPTRQSSESGTGRVPSGNTLYRYQVEFCYLVDEIQRGPQYIVPKVISEANELISNMQEELDDSEAVEAEAELSEQDVEE